MAKQISDSEIMINVLDALDLNAKQLAEKLKFNSHNTVYNVTKGKSGISNDMMNRIMTEFPEISYLYLKKGQGEPLRTGPAVTMQKNILGIRQKESEMPDFINIREYLKLPAIVSQLQEEIRQLRADIEELKKRP